MTAATKADPQPQQADPDGLVRMGAWLFRYRTSLPVPLALVLLLARAGEAPPSAVLVAGGAGLIALGEGVRLWAVHHIGAVSRTRSDRLGPLVASGPFAYVRNPLYLGNIALWVGFALCARLVWLAPIVAALVGVEYHAIVRWEERLLDARRGAEYRAYCARVPRWLPRLQHRAVMPTRAPFSWRETFFSERGTLVAIAVGVALIWIKTSIYR